MRRPWLLLLIAFLIASAGWSADDEYRSVDKAITAKIQPTATSTTSGPAAHLGIHIQTDATGRLVIDEVQGESPAEKAGLKADDILTQFDGKDVASADAFKAALRAKSAGNSVKLSLVRQNDGCVRHADSALSRPMPSA